MSERLPTSVPRLIRLSAIRPNNFNPNRMSPENYRQLVLEVKHIGRLPNPPLLRPIENPDDEKEFEIVDGEHRLRVAADLGMKEVPCMVEQIDEFESRRQCFKRNRGGRDNKAALGRMYADMQKLRGLSRRQLAKEINVPEASIRVAELYARAEEVRRLCAPRTAVRNIEQLTLAQVEFYLALRKSIRDKWLDAGANMKAFACLPGVLPELLAHWLDEFGLAPLLEPGVEFAPSLRRLAPYAAWLDRNRGQAGIGDYVLAVAAARLSVRVVDSLPKRRENGKVVVAISVEQWQEVVDSLSATAGVPGHEVSEAPAAVRNVLAAAGVDMASVLSPAELEAWRVVSESPDFIRQASQLTLAQQRWLSEVDSAMQGHSQDLVLAAKKAACDVAASRGPMSDAQLREAYQSSLRNQKPSRGSKPSPRPADAGEKCTIELAMEIIDRLSNRFPSLFRENQVQPLVESLEGRLADQLPPLEVRVLSELLSPESLTAETVRNWLAEAHAQAPHRSVG